MFHPPKQQLTAYGTSDAGKNLGVGLDQNQASTIYPDIAPSDCHLLRSMDHFIYGRHFAEIDEFTAVVHDFFRSKPTKFYEDVIHSVYEKRKKLIENNGN
ncbi:unnamed protein product [Heligmosomoides polygyrus]|uniref:RGS domain-containing protein n=1 Tax=Heligmosomoides polygyrus TaxID=6339 RepID=A0A183FMK1_HELPZ|nr:unnamed protein product [Heligmosomoides polygyrus]